MATTHNTDTVLLRQMLEYTYRDAATEIILLVTEKTYQELLSSDNRWQTVGRREKKTVEIKPNDGSAITYASILTFKQDIKIDKLGIDINSTQKTKKGNLRIHMREKEIGACKSFREKAENLVENATISTTKIRPKGLLL